MNIEELHSKRVWEIRRCSLWKRSWSVQIPYQDLTLSVGCGRSGYEITFTSPTIHLVFPQSFAKLLFPVSPGYRKLMQFLLGVRGPRGGGEGETREVKGNVEEDKCICFVSFQEWFCCYYYYYYYYWNKLFLNWIDFLIEIKCFFNRKEL